MPGTKAVAGNQTGEETYKNTLKTPNPIGGANAPVARGFHSQHLRELATAPHIHGGSGLGGVELPEPSIQVAPEHPVDPVIHTPLSTKEKIYLPPIGPPTNMAALLNEPGIKQSIEEIVSDGWRNT